MGLAAVAVPLPLLWPLVAVAGGGAVVLGRAAGAHDRGAVATLEALGDAVRAGLAATALPALGGATVLVEGDADGDLVAIITGADDLHAAAWADALAECLGPLDRPRWMAAAGHRAWRVPTAVGATKESAEAFVGALRRRIPSVHLVRAGTPEATALVLAAQASRPDEVDRTLRWR
jgi:hypothetical protein